MTFHPLLQIEVRDFVAILAAQQLLQGSVRQDDALVLSVEQVVLFHVLVDVASDLRARHFSALGDAEECAQLIRDLGGLGETRGRRARVGTLALSLLAGLL